MTLFYFADPLCDHYHPVVVRLEASGTRAIHETRPIVLARYIHRMTIFIHSQTHVNAMFALARDFVPCVSTCAIMCATWEHTTQHNTALEMERSTSLSPIGTGCAQKKTDTPPHRFERTAQHNTINMSACCSCVSSCRICARNLSSRIASVNVFTDRLCLVLGCWECL